MHALILWGWTHSFSTQDLKQEDPCPGPNTLQNQKTSLICCNVEAKRILFQVFTYNAAHDTKNAEDYFMNLSFTPKNCPSTHHVPLWNKWSAAVRFFTEAANLHTRSEQYLCYLLQPELWPAYCIQLLLCFPSVQIKSLHCLCAAVVLHSVITVGLIHSFLYMSIFQCHRRMYFGVTDTMLLVAEGSALCSAASVPCSKCILMENKWLHHIHEMEAAALKSLLVHRLLKPSHSWSQAENWREVLEGMVAMREAEAKHNLSQERWCLWVPIPVVTKLQLK